jgi:hypothetical protein
MHRRLTSALLMALAGQQAAAALPDGLAGPWYNPQQSGHGLSISLVEHGRRAVVLWHTYDRGGAPLTLYIDADTRGRELQGTAFAPRGMRFGDFDPATLDLPVWGAVRIRFDDCDHATLHWEADDPAFGRGATPITRLAHIEGLDCSLPPPNPIAPGLRRAGYPGAGSSGPAAFGMVDSEGRLWALTGSLSDTGSITATLPGPGYLSSFTPLLFLTEPLGALADGSTAVAQRTITPFGAVSTHGVALFDVPRSTRSEGRWTAGADGIGRFRYGIDERLPLAGEQVWEAVPESLARQLQRPAGPGHHRRRRRRPVRLPPASPRRPALGRLCRARLADARRSARHAADRAGGRERRHRLCPGGHTQRRRDTLSGSRHATAAFTAAAARGLSRRGDGSARPRRRASPRGGSSGTPAPAAARHGASTGGSGRPARRSRPACAAHRVR